MLTEISRKHVKLRLNAGVAPCKEERERGERARGEGGGEGAGDDGRLTLYTLIHMHELRVSLCAKCNAAKRMSCH